MDYPELTNWKVLILLCTDFDTRGSMLASICLELTTFTLVWTMPPWHTCYVGNIIPDWVKRSFTSV